MRWPQQVYCESTEKRIIALFEFLEYLVSQRTKGGICRDTVERIHQETLP